MATHSSVLAWRIPGTGSLVFHTPALTAIGSGSAHPAAVSVGSCTSHHLRGALGTGASRVPPHGGGAEITEKPQGLHNLGNRTEIPPRRCTSWIHSSTSFVNSAPGGGPNNGCYCCWDGSGLAVWALWARASGAWVGLGSKLLVAPTVDRVHESCSPGT